MITSAHAADQTATSATVAIMTTSVHSDSTEHCAGTVDLTIGSPARSWVLHQVHINCT